MYKKLSEEERAEWLEVLKHIAPRYAEVSDVYKEIRRIVITYIDNMDEQRNEVKRKFVFHDIPPFITDSQLRLLSAISVEVALLDVENKIIRRFCADENLDHAMTDDLTVSQITAIHDDVRAYISVTYGPIPPEVLHCGIEKAIHVIRAETPATLVREDFDRLVEKHMIKPKE